ncbi:MULTISPECIES: TetR/AcrR family transcriptional regulator [Nocardia]|uniref:TetR/AcrR family transcriptional regulator n=1 Tax=Nocardia TaxID=1817 RepID=UPI000D6993EA|nr:MULTISPECIES: TetR/AcrR family transcriptional regulator [Nocardia]
MTALPPAQLGRRMRNMREKQARILDAATALFAERGYAGVTAQEISDRADIAAGTLFRYAATKGELLLMVYNAEFREALDRGEHAAAAHDDPVGAVLAMVLPILGAADRHVENSVAYQRELLFGPPAETYRTEGTALIAQLETMVATRLLSGSTGPAAVGSEIERRALLAGRGVFAVLHLILASPSEGAYSDRVPDLRDQIAQIVAGFYATATRTPEGRE